MFFQHPDWFLDSEFEEHWWNLSLKQKSYVCVFLLWFFHNRAFFSSVLGKKLIKVQASNQDWVLIVLSNTYNKMYFLYQWISVQTPGALPGNQEEEGQG